MDHGGGCRGLGRLTLKFLTTKDTKDNKDTRGKPCTGSVFVAFLSFVSLVFAPQAAIAQIYETIGIRAQGMSGAFVAVSDDATTTWWNPAGLASGGIFNAVVEFDRTEHPNTTRARAFAVSVPSLGLSYYRLSLSGMRAPSPTESSPESRQDQGVLHQFGATVGQSVGPRFVLASTLKVLRALGDTETDLDVGMMAMLGRMRVGLSAKNLRTPEFVRGEERLELRRQVRTGVSLHAGSGSAAEITVAGDTDLTTTPTPMGDERHVATGVETWFVNKAVGLRTGVGWNTIGETRRSGSVGASVSLRSGIFIDAQLTRGADKVRNGWGFDFRMTF